MGRMGGGVENVIQRFAALALVAALGACGGGGGGGGGVSESFTPLTYQGNTSQATITTTNARALLNAAFGSSAGGQAASVTSVSSAPSGTTYGGTLYAAERIGSRLRSEASRIAAERSRKASGLIVDETQPCDSGSIHSSGVLDDATGVGTVTVRYQNCTLGTVTFHGQVIFNIEGTSGDTITDLLLDFTWLRIIDTDSDLTSSGTIESHLDVNTNTESQTTNMIVLDNTTQRMARAESLLYTIVHDQPTLGGMLLEIPSGRIYDSIAGYVDASTPSPLVFASESSAFPNGGGPLVLAGAVGTRLTATPVDAFQVRLGLDNNGDGTIDLAATTLWAGTDQPTFQTPANPPPPEAQHLRVALATKDLIYDPLRQVIYASVPSSAGANGNSIAVIDPATGAATSYLFVGSEPGKLALSDDAQYLYVGLDGAAAVRRVNLATMTADITITLGSDSFFGPYYPEDIEVLPGAPTSIAVSLRYVTSSPRHAGVAVYDDGVRRTNMTPGHTGSNVIAFGATADRLYGYNNETTEFGFRRMTIDANGVSILESTQNVISGFGVDIAYAGGVVYATSGAAIDPETRSLLGTFTFSSFFNFAAALAPDAANQRVYFLTMGSGSWQIEGFDTATFTSVGVATIEDNSSSATSLIRWGTDGLAFRTDSAVYLLSTSALQKTPPPAPPPVAGTIDLIANDLIYDPSRQRIYASVPSSAFSDGNSIVVIDPASGTVESHVFVGSEPRKLALSDDGQYLYVGLDGSAAIRRVNLGTMTADILIQLGNDSFFGPLFAEDIEVLPGAAHSIAVSLRNSGFSPRHMGVAIYDDAVRRTDVTGVHTGSNVIEFGATAARLYGYNNETTEFGFRRMTVSASGVAVDDVQNNLISGFDVDIKYAGGKLFATSGAAIDPEARTLLGTFTFSTSFTIAASVCPDVVNERVYFLTGTSGDWHIESFNSSTFTPAGSLSIPDNTMSIGSLIRWGTDGLAFRTDNRVYLRHTSDLAL
jgi:hypothetical protein